MLRVKVALESILCLRCNECLADTARKCNHFASHQLEHLLESSIFSRTETIAKTLASRHIKVKSHVTLNSITHHRAAQMDTANCH